MTRVLVVDDDPAITSLVAFKIGRLGFQVSVESDGEAGLAAARHEHPDLVVIDWMMPRMNGLDMCAAIRQDPDPTLSEVPILLLTAKAQETDVERGFAAGATDYIVKPFSPRELIARIYSSLQLERPPA